MYDKNCTLQTLGRSRSSEKYLYVKLADLMAKFAVILDKPNVEPF